MTEPKNCPLMFHQKERGPHLSWCVQDECQWWWKCKEPEKKPKKTRVTKNEYGANVRLTRDEYNKLSKDFGENDTMIAIGLLDDYIGSSGKKYKSHYHTLRGWPMEKVKEQGDDVLG